MNESSPEELQTPELSLFDQDVARLAGEAHDAWRAGRTIMPDGSYEPRPKTTTDEAWIANHDGTTVVDIANTTYADLPADYQEENKASASVALGEAYRVAFYGDGHYGNRDFLRFEHFVDDASDTIHVKWLDRNADWAPAEQKLAYEQLSEEEQRKDQQIYEGAAAIVNERLANGSLKVPDDMLLDWCSQDLEYLKHFSPTGPYADWHPLVGEIQPVSEGNVQFDLEIAEDNLYLHGVYPLDMVAKLARNLRNFSPDSLDDALRNMGAATVRRNQTRQLLASVSVSE